MNILFLDDDEVRHIMADKVFKGHNVIHVYNIAQFVKSILGPVPFDIFSLDHDLGDQNGECLNGNGLMAANLITYKYWDLVNKPEIVVHSWNQPAAEIMVSLLKNSGFNKTEHHPFDHNNVDGNPKP